MKVKNLILEAILLLSELIVVTCFTIAAFAE